MNMMCYRRLLVIVLAFSCLMACRSEQTADEQPTEEKKKAAIPVVTDSRSDLLFTWVADGGPQGGSSVGEVPESVKKQVRVQDPSVPPENRDPSVMFLADLTKPQPDGRYPVKAIKRSEYEAKRRAAEEAAKKAAEKLAMAQKPGGGNVPSQGPAVVSPGGVPVVMYATKHCPVCVKARRWLLEQKIPYVEKDLERDQEAAMALKKKGQAQGVRTNGVPIFEIGGRLLPGFDKAQIVALLHALSQKSKTI